MPGQDPPPEFYRYDQETETLTWTDTWSEPSPVPGVCLGDYHRILEAIERAKHLTPGQIFAQNEAQLEFARRYAKARIE